MSKAVTLVLAVATVAAGTLLAGRELRHQFWSSFEVRVSGMPMVSNTVEESKRRGVYARSYTPSPSEVRLRDGIRVVFSDAFVERRHAIRPRRYLEMETERLTGYQMNAPHETHGDTMARSWYSVRTTWPDTAVFRREVVDSFAIAVWSRRSRDTVLVVFR